MREYLGFNNLGVQEKKEHLVNIEVEANNEVTESSSATFLDCMNEFADKVGKVLDYNINFTLKYKQEVEEQEATEEDYGEEDKQ